MLDRLERITFRLRATFTLMQKFGAARDSFEDAREEDRPSSFPSLFSLQLSPSLANPFCLSWSSGTLKVSCSFLFLGNLTSSSSREFPTGRNGFSIPASVDDLFFLPSSFSPTPSSRRTYGYQSCSWHGSIARGIFSIVGLFVSTSREDAAAISKERTLYLRDLIAFKDLP